MLVLLDLATEDNLYSKTIMTACSRRGFSADATVWFYRTRYSAFW